MEQDQQQRLLEVCKLLLDEHRLKILGILAQQPGNAHELAAGLKLKENLVSRHLARLQEAGLVESVFQADQTLYRLNLKLLHELKKELFALEVAVPEAEENDTDKILSRFLDGDRLSHIPPNHAKRMVVLEWIAAKFEPGVTYPERTVNEMLTQHYPDYASLRRALVDYGFLQREKGVYWRVETRLDSEAEF